MGDLLKKAREKEETYARTQKLKDSKKTIQNIAGTKAQKNLSISVKVNDRLYANFKAINKLKGVSNNSKINELISDYVRANQDCLND